MKYLSIRLAGLSHEEIAKELGYKNVSSFRTSSSHRRVMKGIDSLLRIALERVSWEKKI